MKPTPNPIAAIRQAIHITSVVAHSGKKILRLAVPIIAVVTTVAEELRKKK